VKDLTAKEEDLILNMGCYKMDLFKKKKKQEENITDIRLSFKGFVMIILLKRNKDFKSAEKQVKEIIKHHDNIIEMAWKLGATTYNYKDFMEKNKDNGYLNDVLTALKNKKIFEVV